MGPVGVRRRGPITGSGTGCDRYLPMSYHYLVLPEIFQQVSYLRSTMPPSRCAQPQCNIYSRHSIIVITPYCFVAQPSVVLLTTAAVVWLATAYEATCAATCCALHSLSNMYIRDDTLECSPAFSLFPTTKFPLYFSTSTRVMI